jgi:hypothetical protein
VNTLERSFRRAVRDLEAAGHTAALVGGLAVSARTEARFTRDLDLAVAVTGDADAEALVRGLMMSGYGVVEMIEQEATGRFATARLVTPGNDPASVVVDLLFASSGIEPEIVAQATALEIWPGTIGKVARTGHLIALKLLSRDPRKRPQDQVDLIALITAADADERALAFAATRLIEDRGFSRDRRLVDDLQQLLAELRD